MRLKMFKAIIDFLKVKPLVPVEPIAPYKLETPPVVVQAEAVKPVSEVKPEKKKPAAKPASKPVKKPDPKTGSKPTPKPKPKPKKK